MSWINWKGHSAQAESCRGCAHFTNDPQVLEGLFPGLSSLSSVHASVRSDDGLCRRQDRYLSASGHCQGWTCRKG